METFDGYVSLSIRKKLFSARCIDQMELK